MTPGGVAAGTIETGFDDAIAQQCARATPHGRRQHPVLRPGHWAAPPRAARGAVARRPEACRAWTVAAASGIVLTLADETRIRR